MQENIKAEGSQKTVEKLKEVARIEFMKNGYAATKTRDIANKAEVNLALMNYHFGSKEKLFEIVMLESIDKLFSFILPTLNDEKTSLGEKFDLLSEGYITMILLEPNLPIFVLNEIQQNPAHFGNQIKMNSAIINSKYIAQLKQADPDTDPIQHLITYLGILLFPFFMRPVMTANGVIEEASFKAAIQERQRLAPLWMKKIVGIV